MKGMKKFRTRCNRKCPACGGVMFWNRRLQCFVCKCGFGGFNVEVA